MMMIISTKRQQSGAATLVITVMILILMSIGMFVLTRGTTVDTKIISNEIKSKQAFANAQAGIEYVLAGLESASPDPAYLCSTTTRNTYGFTVQYLDALGAPIAAAECNNIPFSVTTKQGVRSWGYSTDGESVRVLESEIDLTYTWENSHQALPGGAPSGLTAIVTRGSVSFGGAAEVTTCNVTGAEPLCTSLARPGNVTGNPPSGILVRSGGSASLNSGGGNPLTAANVSSNETALANISTNDFFTTYVGGGTTSKTDFLNNASVLDTGRNAANNNPLLKHSGDLRLTGGTIGSPNNPVVLYVDGNISLTGNVIIWGTVYMTGRSFGAGTSKIFGSFLSEQPLNITGNGAIYFNGSVARPATVDPDRTLNSLQNRESNVRMSGWRELIISN